jgi:hypothetical protein
MINSVNLKRKSMKILIGIVAGGIIGFLVGYFGKCSSGTCPMTSNPWTSLLIGSLIGLMSAWDR